LLTPDSKKRTTGGKLTTTRIAGGLNMPHRGVASRVTLVPMVLLFIDPSPKARVFMKAIKN